MLERALAIKERAYGRDHAQVAITLTNLGTAYYLGRLRQGARMLERALALADRRPAEVAATRRPRKWVISHGCSMLERALAINERAQGDHAKLGITLERAARRRLIAKKRERACDRSRRPRSSRRSRPRGDAPTTPSFTFLFSSSAKRKLAEKLPAVLDERGSQPETPIR